MKPGRQSLTHVAFGLILVLFGILTTKGVKTSCILGIECHIPAIKLFQFQSEVPDPIPLFVTKMDPEKSTGIIDLTEESRLVIKDPKFNVTFSPTTVWIINPSKNDTGNYSCQLINSTIVCDLTEEKIDDLKNCKDGSSLLTITPTITSGSDSTNVNVPGHRSSSDLTPSSTSDEKAGISVGAGVGVGVAVGVSFLVSAITAIMCRRRRRAKNKKTCAHSTPHTQSSQKYVYSSVPSDIEKGGVKQSEESRRQDITPEVLQPVSEKTECRQVDEQVLHSVIELARGLTNSPGCSDSSADTTDKPAVKTPNVKTKLLCRRGADGSFEISMENSVCSPDTFSQKESAFTGQEPDQLESPLKTCALAYRDMHLKTSIVVEEQAIPDVHDVVRNSYRDNQGTQQTDSDSVDSKRASEIRLEDVPEKHSLSQTSFPREELQSSHSFADDTHDLTRKAEQMQESPEAFKMIHEQCQCSGNTVHPFETDTTPDMPLSLLTAEKMYFENKLESEDIAEAKSTSRVENIKVRPACV